MSGWDWGSIANVASAVCFILGAAITLVAGIGLLRFPDLLTRMHAGAKPQVLGMMLALLGLALRLRIGWVSWTLLLVVVFQMLTVPVAAHMVGRAGYRTGKIDERRLVVDELAEDIEDAQRD